MCKINHGKCSGVLRSSGFVRKYSQEFKKDVRGLSRGAGRALEREDWNQSRAGRGLGVHRNTLIARLAAWGFRREGPGPSVRPVVGGGPPR